MVKLNPLATWTWEQVRSYASEHHVPTHELLDQGYRSIGCHPCTEATGEEKDGRAGRWVGFRRTECGLHAAP
jgi:phosphoadenosine phosphosulfate reductase